MRLIGESPGRRREVLRVLRASPAPMSIVAIADEVGVHPNTVRFHLDSLVGDGRVERLEPARKAPGRPPLMFRAVRQMDREGARHYRLLAEILAIGLAAERNSRAKALAAGRAWGLGLQPGRQPGRQSPSAGAMTVGESIDRLVGVLDEFGFAPERRAPEGQHQVGLRHCPFLELAEARPGVVCPIHLGLMQGALEAWAAPVAVDRLEPFVEPDLCLAHLVVAGAGR